MTWPRILMAAFLAVGVMSATGEATDLPNFPESVLPAIVNQTEADFALRERIASVFPKLQKTLILEQTRGLQGVSLYRERAPTVVLIATKERLGSGTIIDDEGHVLTNWHVIAGNSPITVIFKPQKGEDLKKDLGRMATVERIDQEADLALLKIISPPRPFVFMRLGESSSLEVGQDVFAIGHPQGQFWTFTKGIISQIRPNYEWPDLEPKHRATVIQTQTPIHLGSSGGPLLNKAGRLIGVNTFLRPNSPGLNYAVAVDTVKSFLEGRSPRQASPPSTSATQPPKLNCPELYDTAGLGWENVAGCYQNSSSPPPDYWLVSRDAQGLNNYIMRGSKSKLQLDTLIETSDLNPNEVVWKFDTNCNGLIDLFGYQPVGSLKIERYAAPPGTFFLSARGKELYEALNQRKLPYPAVQFCP